MDLSDTSGSDAGMTMDDSTSSSSSKSPPKVQGTGDREGGGLDPSIMEGMYVIDAHMAANKIALSQDLLTGPNNGGGRNDYSFASLRSSLHFMITIGMANQTFYIGQETTTTTTTAAGDGNRRREDASSAAYGLVNIAAFVAMSVEDSISRGSCDETNVNVLKGVMPFSNACGQFGLNY